MKVTFFGHACLKICYEDSGAILMDPWFSREGAFFGSWFQFPENSTLLDDALQGVTDICLSHNHADHFDPPVLRFAFSRNPLLILHVPRYQTDWFVMRISRFLVGFENRIIEHPPYESFPVGKNASVFFVPEESPAFIDSAIVCMVGGKSLVNLNDSRLTPEQLLRIRQVVKRVDYLTLQASGASEYPINYTYPENEKRLRSIEKRRNKLEYAKRVIDIMKPCRALFFAGPPVFLDQTLSSFNRKSAESVFPDQLEVLREMERDRPDIAERTFFVLPGEELSDIFLWRKTDDKSKRFLPFKEREAYIADYMQRRRDVCAFDWSEPPSGEQLLSHFNHMATLSRYMSERIGGEVTFIVKGETEEKVFTVDFAGGTARKGTSLNPLYVLTVPASCVMAILNGTATWDDVFLSFRMTFDERTDYFIPHFKVLLKYMNAGLFVELERYEKKLSGEEGIVPMMDVTFGGETFHLQRFCPHAGTDLKRHGQINSDGTITCLAHRLCFDLKTGSCTNARVYQLKVGRPHSMKAEPKYDGES